ncbi:MAG TPA: hypothetical protein VL595_15085 [Pseudonocardia sp.]|jgi:hypothetical protein|nr:hypothetical protein [Pseudonocardia sp.]
MNEELQDRIVRVLGTVEGSGSDEPDALWELADLVFLTTILDQLSERAEHQLAARPTVTAHIGQARSQMVQLRRSLTHATEMLAFNTARHSPLQVS